MLKRFSYLCDQHGEFDELVEGYVGQSPCPRCGANSPKILSCPSIHTLSTHFKGFRGDSAEEQFVPGYGGYRDINLCDAKTGEPQTYSSLSEKKKLLEANGLFEKGPAKDNFAKPRNKRTMRFTGVGAKTSQVY